MALLLWSFWPYYADTEWLRPSQHEGQLLVLRWRLHLSRAGQLPALQTRQQCQQEARLLCRLMRQRLSLQWIRHMRRLLCQLLLALRMGLVSQHRIQQRNLRWHRRPCRRQFPRLLRVPSRLMGQATLPQILQHNLHGRRHLSQRAIQLRPLPPGCPLTLPRLSRQYRRLCT